MMRFRALLLGIVAGFGPCLGAFGVDLLPDLIVSPAALRDHVFVTNIVPGRLHIRLSNATPNVGLGELRVREGATNGRQQAIDQVIRRSNGTFFTRPAGVFVFHPTHAHFHVDDWAEYRIREVLPADGVGPVLYRGQKTSFCLLDSRTYPGPVPIQGTPAPTRQFATCSDVEQGISVGWEDLYDKSLPDQWIDVTGLTAGEYWLESEVDPEDHFLETDESNNVDRIKLVIAGGSLPVPDEIPLDRRLPLLLSIVVILLGAAKLGARRNYSGGREINER